MLKPLKKAFREGCVAGTKNLSIGACPYRNNFWPFMQDAWESGWMKESKKTAEKFIKMRRAA